MLPSLLAREVQSGLKHFLTTGFEPSDPLFHGILKRFTEDQSHWMKGPYLQIGLPFRTGTSGRNFFADFETEFPGFVHQEAAWERLASNRIGAGTLVATGTGSGKTECFVYPLLDHCARARKNGQEGIQALVIYPMNALATDQARRFAQIISKTPDFKGVRVGLFVGGKTGRDGRGQTIMSAEGVITDRATLRKEPPDILLTNYKMLDYLLIRPKDRQLWSRNKPGTLRYVVVDELHTFDGAQGTDLALLLRRLKARLKVENHPLIYAGTSATLGSNTDTAPLREYARQIFGADFGPESVITEARLSPAEFLGEQAIEHVLHPVPDLGEILNPERYATPEAAIAEWFGLFFPGEEVPAKVDDPAWRRRLGTLLKGHLLFVNLVKHVKGQIVALSELHHQMQGPAHQSVRPHMVALLDALLALVAWARDPKGRPLVTLRIQLWMRELRRMVATVDTDPAAIELISSSDLQAENPKLHLPLVQCPDCRTTGWLSRQNASLARVSTVLEEIYNTWFAGQPEILRLYGREGIRQPHCEVVPKQLCTRCGCLQMQGDPCTACGHAPLLKVHQVVATLNMKGRDGLVFTRHDKRCPSCGSTQEPLLVGARTATVGSVAIEQLWASPFNDDKKLIAFSDSVQDAAHRAGFFSARTYLNTIRTGLSQVIDLVARPVCRWPEFLSRAETAWRELGSPLEMPKDRFVAEFIGPNMTWQRDWVEGLLQQEQLPLESQLPERVRKRLAWQAFAEFTYLNRRGRNLESIGKAVLAPALDDLEQSAERLLPILREKYGLRHLKKRTVLHWLWGFLCQMRLRGGVTHPEMKSYMRDGNVYAFSSTAGRKEWLPGLGPRTAQPRFLTLGSHEHFDRLTGTRSRTFYQIWAEAVLGAEGLFPEGAESELYGEAIGDLEQAGLIVRMESDRGDVLGLNAERLLLDTRVSRLGSETGKRMLSVPEMDAEHLLGMPCLDSPYQRYSRMEPGGGWLARQFSRGDLRRVYSAEHTGLLERDQREALETRFKSRTPHPWHENLLSATPTLEMGVDIGDLSSVMLCSVPPNQANYLQRIGRAGRRDGNAFAATLADGVSPHDLYFFEDTEEMLSGEVVSPGIFLKAPEVLRRQLFAFCLDDWVGSDIAENALPDKTKEALDARDAHSQDRFPYTFLAHVQAHEERLLREFQGLLGADLDGRVANRLEAFMHGTEEEDALRIRLTKLLDELSRERRSYKDRADEAKRRIRDLEKLPRDEAVEEQIEQMKHERQKALELAKEINQRDLLNTLTDSGLIPNYAFPEAGVELKSLLWRKRSSDDREDTGAYVSLPAERYERPANSALSEFAPENVFYANQRRVEVDQINLELSPVETWRLCPSCEFMRNLSLHADSDGACPRCGDPLWANISQKRFLLRFKQAVASSNDPEVRIDDSAEDREPKFYQRQMMCDFDPAHIREAYRLKAAETAFGFEFIEKVVFRDVNFGEITKPGETYAVSGKQRLRPGFNLCIRCGQVQRPPRTAAERTRTQIHSFDCPLRDSDAPENLVRCLYLYREFSSEALRILVPYTASGVDEICIESFMAALRVGLKQRYGGKVDHLRLTRQEQKSTDGGPNRHYVLLYDSVPGGTGYLHELLADGARTLTDVLHLALERIRTCRCTTSPEKDGCYRCVYQHRLGRAMQHVSRTRAQQVLEQLVGSLSELEQVQSVADIFINPNFDSELESKFLESLRRLSGREGIPFVRLEQEIVEGKSGYFLEAGEQRYWVVPQVELSSHDGVEVASKPDFVIRPTQRGSMRRPVAVFCDGWAYHRALTREDARKRNALVASGRFHVWSVTWEDVQNAMQGQAGIPLHEGMEAMCFQNLPSSLQPKFDPVVWERNAVAALLHWLASRPTESADPYQERLAHHAAATAFRMIPPPQEPRSPTVLEAQRQLSAFWTGLDPLPCDPPSHAPWYCGNTDQPGVILRYHWPAALLQHKSGTPLPASPGFVVLDESAYPNDPDLHLGWRRWLALFNVFQMLPGVFLATRTGLDQHDHHALSLRPATPAAASPADAAHAAGWSAVIEQAMDSLHRELGSLRDAGLPPPEEVGFELEQNGDVIAEAELAWTRRKVVLLLPAHLDSKAVWESRHWTAVSSETGWPERLTTALAPTRP